MPIDLCKLITAPREGVPRGAISSSRKPKAICAMSARPISQCKLLAMRSEGSARTATFQNFSVADTPASQVRPGAGSKNRLLPSLTITEPAYRRSNKLSTLAKLLNSHAPEPTA